MDNFLGWFYLLLFLAIICVPFLLLGGLLFVCAVSRNFRDGMLQNRTSFLCCVLLLTTLVIAETWTIVHYLHLLCQGSWI